MVPENDLLAHFKHLFLLRILGKEREGGTLTNETTYNKDTFDASFSFITICLRFALFLSREIRQSESIHYPQENHFEDIKT